MTALACETRRADFDAPGRQDEDLAKELVKLCRHCPILQACGEWAFTRDITGFAAGFTRAERRKLQREAAAA